jgi:hypothetical protein
MWLSADFSHIIAIASGAFDAPDTYHFYYGDQLGRPGALLDNPGDLELNKLPKE